MVRTISAAELVGRTLSELVQNTAYSLALVGEWSETVCQTTNTTSAEVAAAPAGCLRMDFLLLHNRVSESVQHDPGRSAESVQEWPGGKSRYCCWLEQRNHWYGQRP
jgi:hypothetical protein